LAASIRKLEEKLRLVPVLESNKKIDKCKSFLMIFTITTLSAVFADTVVRNFPILVNLIRSRIQANQQKQVQHQQEARPMTDSTLDEPQKEIESMPDSNDSIQNEPNNPQLKNVLKDCNTLQEIQEIN
jgi:hypothetical protein